MREAMIDGQLCDWSEAPVPMVYESPSARYRIASSILPIPLRARRARLPASGEDTFLALYIGQRVAVAVEGGDDQRLAGGGQQQGIRGVDQLRFVPDRRMPGRRGVELLFEHALVHRADCELGAAEHLRLDPLGVAEGEVGHDPAGTAADLLGPESPLVEVVAFAPFPRAVGVVDGHPDHRDGRVDAGEWTYARDAPAGADDDPPVDLLAQDCVGAADVAGALGRDRGRLDPVPELSQRVGGVEHDLVARSAPLCEGEVEVAGLDVEGENRRVKEPERLAEQLLAGLVAVQHGDGRCRHRSNDMARSMKDRAVRSDGRRCRSTGKHYQPKGREHPQLVGHAPVLDHQPVLEPHHVEDLDVRGFPGRRMPEEGSKVGPAAALAGPHLVAVDNQILDGEGEVWKGGAKDRCGPLGPVYAVAHSSSLVLDRMWRDELIRHLHPSLVEYLVDEPSIELLVVVLCHRCANLLN